MNLVVLIIGLLFCYTAEAEVWVPKTGTLNTVTWEAQGFPGFLRINGEGGKVKGRMVERGGVLNGRFTVNLRKYTTGMDLRDEHMHDKYLQTKKYKTAILDIFNLPGDNGDKKFKGELKIKGQTRPVVGDINLNRKGSLIHVEASFTVVITDYPAIGVPSFKGITVAEKVKVDAVFDLVRQ